MPHSQAAARDATARQLMATTGGAPLTDRVPVTILSGYLGSGKTTLLNHILTVAHGKKIAVIENEYGEVAIDDALIATRHTADEGIVAVLNGCVCCSVRSDLVNVLKKLAERQRQGTLFLDAIVIDPCASSSPVDLYAGDGPEVAFEKWLMLGDDRNTAAVYVHGRRVYFITSYMLLLTCRFLLLLLTRCFLHACSSHGRRARQARLPLNGYSLPPTLLLLTGRFLHAACSSYGRRARQARLHAGLRLGEAKSGIV